MREVTKAPDWFGDDWLYFALCLTGIGAIVFPLWLLYRADEHGRQYQWEQLQKGRTS